MSHYYLHKLLLILVLSVLSLITGEAYSQSAKSDILYEEGVELYNSGKYETAVEKFREVWRLDSLEMSPTDTRQDYSKEWLAASLWHAGNKNEAKYIAKVFYDLEPVDRRLTVKHDEFMNEGFKSMRDGNSMIAMIKFEWALKEAEKICGKDAPQIGSECLFLAQEYYALNDLRQAMKYARRAEEIFDKVQTESVLPEMMINMVYAANALADKNIRDTERYLGIASLRIKDNLEASPFSCGLILNLINNLAYINGDPTLGKDVAIETACAFLALTTEAKTECADLIRPMVDILRTNGVQELATQIADSGFEIYPLLQAKGIANKQYEATLLDMKANLAQDMGDYKGAIDNADKCIAILEAIQEFDKNNLFEIVYLKACAYCKLQDFTKGEKYARQALSYVENLGDEWEGRRLEINQLIAYIYNLTGRTNEAIAMLEGINTKLRSGEMANNLQLSRNYFEIAAMCASSGNLDKSLKALEESKKLYESSGADIHNEMYFQILLAIIEQGHLYVTKNNIEAVRAKYNTELDRLEQIASSATNPSVKAGLIARVIHGRAKLALTTGDNSNALKYATKAINILEGAGIEVPDDFLITQANAAGENLDFSTQLNAMQQNLDTLRKNGETQSLEYFLAFSSYIKAKGNNLKFEEAQEMIKDATDCYYSLSEADRISGQRQILTVAYMACMAYDFTAVERILGDFDARNHNISKNNPSLYFIAESVRLSMQIARGEFAEALELSKKLIRDLKALNVGLFDSVSLRMLIAKTYHQAGMLSESADLYSTLFTAVSKAPEQNADPTIMIGFYDYVQVLNELGKSTDALAIIDTIMQAVDNVMSDGQMVSYITLVPYRAAMLYAEKGGAEAKSYLYDMISKVSEINGDDSTVTMSLKSEVFNYISRAEIKEEVNRTREYIDAMRKKGTEILPRLLHAYAMASSLINDNDNFSYAVALLEERDRKGTLNISTMERIKFTSMKAMSKIRSGKLKDGIAIYRESFDNARQYILDNFLTLSAAERNGLWNQSFTFFKNEIPTAAIAAEYSPASTGLVYDAVLFSTSLLMASEKTVAEAVSESRNRGVRKLYETFLKSKNKSNALRRAMADENTIAAATADQEVAERNLLKALSDKLGQYNARLSVKWEDVRDVLEANEAAVELIEIPIDQTSSIYCGLTLRKDFKAPKMYHLVTVTTTENPFKDCYDNTKLTESLWHPLADDLKGATKVWFAAQGKASVTAIESLPGIESITDVEGTSFRRLTSTRELVFAKDNPHIHNAAIYGGINYSLDKDIMVKDANNYQRAAKGTTRYIANDEDFRRVGKGIKPLPGTLEEGKSLAGIINVSTAITTIPDTYFGDRATETSFKAFSGKSPSLLHIGTHGFFYSDEASRTKEYFKRLDNYSSSPEEMAMNRSGLLFAGANGTLNGEVILPEGVDDGVLTASEIAQLNLNNTELTVMSACETALGNLGADGVFGLQRGFKKAGAKGLMMSLWKVDDMATSILMKNFYSNWLIDNMDKYNALEKAKEAVRSDSRFSDPRYWAPFILLDAF